MFEENPRIFLIQKNASIGKLPLFCFQRNLAAPRYSSNNLNSSNSVTTRQNANEFASALAAQSFGYTLGLHNRFNTISSIRHGIPVHTSLIQEHRES